MENKKEVSDTEYWKAYHDVEKQTARDYYKQAQKDQEGDPYKKDNKLKINKTNKIVSMQLGKKWKDPFGTSSMTLEDIINEYGVSKDTQGNERRINIKKDGKELIMPVSKQIYDAVIFESVIKFKPYTSIFVEAEDIKDEAKENKELEPLVIELFTGKKTMDDSDVHSFAEEKGIDVHEFEDAIYAVLISIVNGGKSAGKDIQVSDEIMKIGKEVESEHTDNEWLKSKIVKDHVSEFPNYYEFLVKMEDELKKQNKEAN